MNDFKNDDFWLMQGDCLERMKEIPDDSVDMVLTDPPYGTTACKWDTVIDLDKMWEQLERVIKHNGAIVMTASQPFTSALVMSNPKMFKYDWTWKKPKGTGHLNAKRMPMRDKEDILVFYQKQPNYNPQMTKGEPFGKKTGSKQQSGTTGTHGNTRTVNTGFRHPKQVLEFNVVGRGGTHPTQKPVSLMEYLIRTYTNEGETVLDFTMGSGTTGVACDNLSRKFIGIELDEDYYQTAKHRILSNDRSN